MHILEFIVIVVVLLAAWFFIICLFRGFCSIYREECRRSINAEGKTKEVELAMAKMKEDHGREISKTREEVAKELALMKGKKNYS